MANQAPVLTGTPGDKKVTLTWTNVNAQNYKVQRQLNGNWTTLQTQTSRTYVHQPLVNGQSYTYRIKASFSSGSDTTSNTVVVTLMVPILAAPVLTGTAGDAQNVLDWNDISGAVDYNVKRAIGTGAATFLASTTSSAYTDNAVTNGTLYRYTVKAMASDPSRNSAPSNEVSLTPVTAQPPTVAPTLTGVPGDHIAILNWNNVSAVTYKVQRGPTWATIQTLGGGVTAYTDTGLNNDVPHSYRVRATYSYGPDRTSNEVTVTPFAQAPPLGTPVLTGTAGNNRNTLDWNDIPAADGYRVRKAIGPTGNFVNLPDITASTFVDNNVTNGTLYRYSVRAFRVNGDLSPHSNEIALTPVAPQGMVYHGYAGLAGITGGTGGQVYTPSTYAAFKSALQASGSRIVRPTGSANIDGGGENLTISNGNLTIDGSNFGGSFKRLSIQIKASNVIMTQLRLRPGDQVSTVDDADGLTINPGQGSVINKILIDHCSISWGPDVTLAVLNRVEDLTVQFSILGPGLYTSAHSESPHSYGVNVTVPGNSNPDTEYGRRHTFYRSVWIHNWGRNFKFEQVDGVEAVNCVVYDWGKELGHGNPRHANVVGNMFKKGPETESSNQCWEPDPNYGQFADSTYLPVSGADRNIGLGFTPTYDISAAARLDSPYGGGLHNVTVQAADSALATAVVNAAGPTVVDAVDQGWKDDFANDEGSFWFGPGKGNPVPYWP